MKWNSILYDKKHDFVAEYGKGLLEFVPKNDGLAILDLGCGLSEIESDCTNIGALAACGMSTITFV